MVDEPITVRDDSTVHDAAKQLVEHKLVRVPVLDASGALVGTIGRPEIVRALAATEL